MSARLSHKKAIVDPGRLSGPEKAAVVLLALGEDHNVLWQAMDEEEIKEISQAMAGLGTVTSGDKVDTWMEEIRGPAGRTMWDKLANVNEAVLANYLKNEYPQTVAVVLSKIKAEHSARVLAALPED